MMKEKSTVLFSERKKYLHFSNDISVSIHVLHHSQGFLIIDFEII